MRYAFVIKFMPEKADEKLLAGRCIKTLHYHHGKCSNFSVGVGFPSWSSESLGRHISFSGVSSRQVCELNEEHYFKFMKNEGFFGVSDVFEVPEHVYDVRFIRNQGVSKCFAGERRRRMLRAKRRAENRGEVYSPDENLEERVVDNFHVAYVDSSSTNQRFALFIQKEIASDEVSCGYNAYGLSTNSHHRGTVPELGHCLETIF
ncbi:type I-F CRISPR-associated endoribonuclease Cas6/Csy4 [Zobellella aerophila]|uniref:Uncharacterized protein n=1 Tax=Zobellella aerophila TaxID=870480 RepID=A0ABP6V6V5_9GAMM